MPWPAATCGGAKRKAVRAPGPAIMALMSTSTPWHSRLTLTGQAAQHWIAEWWQLAQLAAVILVLTLSPSSYQRANRRVLAWHVYTSTAPVLLGFSLLCALVSLVLTRIVVVTAHSYGLSQYGLQLVIRVLVLELIPLTATLFVALRCTIPDGAELTALQASGQLERLRNEGAEPMRQEVLPRVVAGMFAGITLAALSCVVALAVAYVTAYGFAVSGLAGFSRLFGQVFTPAVTLILVVKTLFFCLAVSIIPMASALYGMRGASARSSAEMRGLVRMFAVLVLVEVASLVGNYY